ncbi:MAG: DegT/DnrJ/EryC1/StrS aminotransferase family protein [Pseudomonadota bacterium]
MSLKPKLIEKPARIDFIDLAAQQARIRPQLDAAITKVLNHGAYIMGPEVAELERQLSAFCGAKYTLSCSNGTDAMSLVLMAKNVGPGDAVLVPSFTFAATAEVVALRGATPIFIDSDASFNIDPAQIDAAVAVAKKQGLNPVGIIPVYLFGLPPDYARIHPLAEKHGLWVMGDAAQGFGSSIDGKRAGSLTSVTTTSFFPAKPLGCYGDGGAVMTDDKELFDIMESIRVHGKGTEKYDNVRIGLNGRLDTLQAAILIEKLAIFADEIAQRQRVATRYNDGLRDVITTPSVPAGQVSAWAQYTLVCADAAQRSAIQASLKEAGVPTMVYYPKPLHQQTAYKHYPTATGGALPVCEQAAQCVFSLPMHPYLTDATLDYIIDATRRAIAQPR